MIGLNYVLKLEGRIMKKIRRFIVLWITLLSSTMTLSGCMVTRAVMPDGFEQVIKEFDVFTVEIRSVNYVVPQNTLRVNLILNIDIATEEDVSQLLNVLTEYFRTERFTEFMDNIQEDNPEPFSISLSLFNENDERTHLLGASLNSNFEWGSGLLPEVRSVNNGLPSLSCEYTWQE